jgi:hypothetical protein
MKMEEEKRKKRQKRGRGNFYRSKETKQNINQTKHVDFESGF